jgi:Protein of unknown function (DUF2892)
MGFSKFMSSMLGRVVRIIAGIALIAIGLSMGNTGGIVIAIVGVVPLLAGVFDVCLIGTLLFGTPLQGSKVRAQLK